MVLDNDSINEDKGTILFGKLFFVHIFYMCRVYNKNANYKMLNQYNQFVQNILMENLSIDHFEKTTNIIINKIEKEA